MLIKALCDYYDAVAEEGNILPKEGYSKVSVQYCIALTREGKIDEIINWQDSIEVKIKDRVQRKLVPRKEMLPLREQTTTICANIVEHRAAYIFGLKWEKDHFDVEEAKHQDFVKRNLGFIEGIDSPVVNAYRNFILNWNPVMEVENTKLIELGKKYDQSSFVFCLSGRPDLLLHSDTLLKEKWEQKREKKASDEPDTFRAQCAITGKYNEPIARIHNKIKGVSGGLATGTVMVGYNFPAVCSYTNEQSYNSSISEEAMEKYTTALNLLLEDKRHNKIIDDMTVLYWANGSEKTQVYADWMTALCFGETDTLDEKRTEQMLNRLMYQAKEGKILQEQIESTDDIDENVDFYIIGIKPNTSRVSLKFIYRKRFGEILHNIAIYQKDLQMGEGMVKSIPLWRIKKALISPNATKEKAHQALVEELFKAVICGTEYPMYLLSVVVRRVKIDRDVDAVRAGIIKACINRKARTRNKKEELTLALDTTNTNQAYLCGRLFAVLEKLQQDASGGNLNRTIKDAFFASATSKPMLVFPKLLILAQNHLKKVSSAVYYNQLIQKIISDINGEFPCTLTLSEQGKFIVGYYQQYNEFFKPRKHENDEKTEEV